MVPCYDDPRSPMSMIGFSGQPSERVIFFTLAQLCVIILAARVAGHIAARVGQAAVVGEIIAGILLGPSLFGLASLWQMAAPIPPLPPVTSARLDIRFRP